MKRRMFIGVMAGGLLTVPLAVEAQPARKVPHVGVLQAGAPPEPLVEAFREGLRDLGYVGCRSHKWTQIDSLQDYQVLVDAARSEANGRSLPEWELELYNEAQHVGAH